MADKITALSQFFINNPQVVPYKWAKNYISSSSVEITRTNRTRALPGSVKFQKLHTKNRQRMCSLSCFATSENVGFFRNGIGDGDGIIIVDHGSHRHESNLMLDEFVKMFKDQTGYPIVEPAHMELAEPSIKDAFSICVQKGAKRVVVSPFFLFPGRHWQQDIPSLTADVAKEFPGIAYLITAPLGLHNLLVDVVNDRIKHCLGHAQGDADECEVCAGTGKCKLYNAA
ncbi:PREDICTED: sirohydrochlorin ferrochelatase, chloroplastic-like isoform X1 [Tarenaya hassleriana]|uniref:sirohydrochlorin ferrochelatase, chloroplastic-like isoform X1 n=1 Tax=Tarenaya hassleriana TaxID=28532 RepID=UPI00053C256D|nr:PREDICTED: sirohydrochlorin ferrochelatase, chloroplastic-like isoform X1 [Tarenaya hassleriana]XP_010530524.1 PREDICTED: sirohydrochlorin ferrochelatase, chloroplastic-like isoform X1 [Tarenaya hassleriana]XP_010530525.1 PREDICTED: sirohydrochlorin ferrochelatase, chloroplastic-like isoform X1 [Tarenaya hassleriana]